MNKVEAAIIHKLVKDRHGAASTQVRELALKLTPPVMKLVEDIHDLYAEKPGKGYGRFEADEINYPAAIILRSHFQAKSASFLDTSKKLMSVLAAKASPWHWPRAASF